jgi:hypothetical protein
MAALHDRELVELLASEPELLAISDAIAATAVRRKRPFPRLAAVSVAVAVATVVALVAPWSQSRGGVLQRALAAVSTNSVLHVVLVSRVPSTSVVDLASGRAMPTTLRQETWFDAKGALKRTVVSRGGVTSILVETPQGAWSQSGPVASCSWIAAHPIRATKLRVSCSASGRNGTTPRKIAETRPSADPALAAFTTGYRSALRSGRARNLGAGHLGKRPIYWIGFGGEGSKTVRSERVAIDRRSFKPLLYEVTVGGQVVAKARVAAIGSVAYRRSLFARPSRDRHPAPSAGEVATTRHVSRAGAEAALKGQARALGTRFSSLPLIDAKIDRLTTGYGPLSGIPVTRAAGVEFVYGDSGGFLNGNPFLRLSEALSPQMAYGQTADAMPREGMLLLTRVENETVTPSGGASARRALWLGQTKVGNLYVSLQGSSRPLVVSGARALERNQ